MAAAQALGATPVQYPKPSGEYEGRHQLDAKEPGIRIGVIARETSAAAWEIAWQRFPGDRRGQLTHQLAMAASDSVWHKQLSQLSIEMSEPGRAYWLHPFENYRTFCPYLVGDHDEVAAAVQGYLAVGFRTFILDVPTSQEDMDHIGLVFERASRVLA
jgi:alkanesulfonate monooxygenase